ncbi:MAG: Hsp20/alpha crystallin family protein [Aeriscardovia sp.]|nr:Hsp20/alpha crystallin family protein [Aeriscardovia sp.]MBR4414017.1 Hsp20/alpha crystallin family protein [Aeriscardovia sp.]
MAFLPAVFNNSPFDDAVTDFFTEQPVQRYTQKMSSAMATDIKEIDNTYEVTIEIPGFDKHDIHVRLKDGYLTVLVQQESTTDHSVGKYIHQERYMGSRSRSFYVGKNLKSSDVKASFSNGVLTLSIPKEVEVPKEEDQTVEIN